jgi:hypothetical protein
MLCDYRFVISPAPMRTQLKTACSASPAQP